MEKFYGYDEQTTEALEKIYETTRFSRREILNLFVEIKDLNKLREICAIAYERNVSIDWIAFMVSKPLDLNKLFIPLKILKEQTSIKRDYPSHTKRNT